jgi:hypothetical protein
VVGAELAPADAVVDVAGEAVWDWLLDAQEGNAVGFDPCGDMSFGSWRKRGIWSRAKEDGRPF